MLGDGPITGKTDGVVAYESAHIDGVESEKVVRSGYSTQGHPETIEEVRRILREHIGAMRENLAAALNAEIACVSIKAKTGEGLDAVGRGEAVSAQAVVLLRQS